MNILYHKNAYVDMTLLMLSTNDSDMFYFLKKITFLTTTDCCGGCCFLPPFVSFCFGSFDLCWCFCCFGKGCFDLGAFDLERLEALGTTKNAKGREI